MWEEIVAENGRISDFQGLVMHHSSTSTYTPNFTEIEDIFLWTDGRADGRTDIWDPLY